MDGRLWLVSAELFVRYERNPILAAAGWPYTVNAVLNPGVARFGGETLLLVRVEDRTASLIFAWPAAPTG
jgi:predicted GH43/DUF377 family glycosyl hydrolase